MRDRDLYCLAVFCLNRISKNSDVHIDRDGQVKSKMT